MAQPKQAVLVIPQISNSQTINVVVGGTKRIEKMLEGEIIPIPFGYNFDSCKFGGCWEMQRNGNEDSRQRLAERFDLYMKDNAQTTLSIRFDYSRIDLFEEALIPIILSGTINNNIYSNIKAFIFTDNNCS